MPRFGSGFYLAPFMVAFAAEALCQEPKLTARDLFYEAASPASAGAMRSRSSPSELAAATAVGSPPTTRPSIRYGVLQQQPDGQFLGVDPSATIFYSGDKVRIHVEANQAGFLYILQRGSSGRWSVLFPAEPINGGQNRVPAFQPCEVPPLPGKGFVFDNHAGEEAVWLAFAPNRVGVGAILALIDQPPDAKGAAQLARTSPSSIAQNAKAGSPPIQSRDLILEKTEEDSPEAFKGIALYAAAAAAGSDSVLLVHFRLIHLEARGK